MRNILFATSLEWLLKLFQKIGLNLDVSVHYAPPFLENEMTCLIFILLEIEKMRKLLDDWFIHEFLN